MSAQGPFPEPASAVSIAASMARHSAPARAVGSSASVNQRTTTKWRAPAATSGPTVSGSTPPVIQTGHGERATAVRMYPMPVPGRPGFVGVAATGPAER